MKYDKEFKEQALKLSDALVGMPCSPAAMLMYILSCLPDGCIPGANPYAYRKISVRIQQACRIRDACTVS